MADTGANNQNATNQTGASQPENTEWMYGDAGYSLAAQAGSMAGAVSSITGSLTGESAQGNLGTAARADTAGAQANANGTAGPQSSTAGGAGTAGAARSTGTATAAGAAGQGLEDQAGLNRQ